MKIVLVENINTGNMVAAVLPEGTRIGSDVYNGQYFDGPESILALEDITIKTLLVEMKMFDEPFGKTREAAAEALWKKMTKTSAIYIEETEEMAKTVKQAAKPRGKKEAGASSGRRGRASSFVGKKIYIKTEGKENPRRQGTAGYKSFSKISNGITFEEYIAAGGRPQDLAWDIKKGNVELR